jgi:hypothetical protein
MHRSTYGRLFVWPIMSSTTATETESRRVNLLTATATTKFNGAEHTSVFRL